MLLRISWREGKTVLPKSSNNQRPWIHAFVNNKEKLLKTLNMIIIMRELPHVVTTSSSKFMSTPTLTPRRHVPWA